MKRNKDLYAALAKEPADLTPEDVETIKANAESLTEEERETFAEILEGDEIEKGIDMETVKNLVTKSIQDALATQVDEISGKILGKFMKGAKIQREKVLGGGEVKKDITADGSTREFMKALLSGDKARIKALTDTTPAGSSPDDANAGALIPTELRNEIMRIAETQYGLARREMLYLPFTGPGNSRVIPSLGTSVSVSWTGEGVAKTSTQPTFSVVTQTLKKLAAIVPMTEEILEDSAINLTGLLGALFAEAVSKEEDIQFFAGTGAPWTGILNNGSVNQQTQATGDVNQVTADDLLDLIDKTPSGALNGAKFYMHRSVFSKVRKLKAATTGEYIFQNPGGGRPSTIWDYPFELSDAFPAATAVTTGKAYILFGNLKQAAVFGDKQQLRVKLLDQASITDTDGTTPINLAEQDMVALRIVERVGYVVAQPKAASVLKAAAHLS